MRWNCRNTNRRPAQKYCGNDLGNVIAVWQMPLFSGAVPRIIRQLDDQGMEMDDRATAPVSATDAPATRFVPEAGGYVEYHGNTYRIIGWAHPAPVPRRDGTEYSEALADCYDTQQSYFGKKLQWCARDQAEYLVVQQGPDNARTAIPLSTDLRLCGVPEGVDASYRSFWRRRAEHFIGRALEDWPPDSFWD